jgi:hypothetical protein
LLALATTEQPPSCRRRVIQTPPSSDIKIARLRFLFVLRLRTGVDLRDQADLAPARSVTIGSWFSDCIGASSLARRSRIVRVNNHQIGFISTHRKIGHPPLLDIVRKFKMGIPRLWRCRWVRLQLLMWTRKVNMWTRRSTEAWSGHSSTWQRLVWTSSSRYVCALVFKHLRGLRIGKQWSEFSGTCVTLPTSSFGTLRPLLWRFMVFQTRICQVSVG